MWDTVFPLIKPPVVQFFNPSLESSFIRRVSSNSGFIFQLLTEIVTIIDNNNKFFKII